MVRLFWWHKEKSGLIWTYFFILQVNPDQLIQPHSPLSMFREFHKKHTLVIGKGHVEEIARELGFTNIRTLDDMRVDYSPLSDDSSHRVSVNIF